VLLSASQRDAHEPTLSKADANGGIWGCPRNPQAIRCNELDPVDLRSQNLLGKLIYRPNDSNEFKFTGEYFNREATVDQKFDLGAATGLGPSPTGSGTIHGFVRTAEQERWRATIRHDWNAALPFLDSVRWQLNYSPQQRDFTGNQSYTRTTGATGVYDRYYLHHYQEHFWEGDVQLKSTLQLPGATHRFTYGYYGNLTKTDYERQDIYNNLTTGVVTNVMAGGFNFANADTIRSDGFIQDEISLFNDKLLITPGVRYSYYNLDPRPDSNYKAVAGAEPRLIEEDNLSKKIGLIYKFTDHLSLFGQYAEGFKMPTAEQLYKSVPNAGGAGVDLIPNPNLKPESVKSYEAGLRGKFDRGFFSVSVFKADYKDFIASFSPAPGGDLTYDNRAVVEIRGWEVFGELKLTDKWFANASLTAQRGDQIVSLGQPMVPFNGASPLTLVTGLKYVDLSSGLTGEFVGKFVDEVTRTQEANHFKPEGYAVFDTIWSWKIGSNWTLRGAIYNIFDERYFAWPMANTYLTTVSNAVKISNPLELQTQPGRTFRVGLSATF